MGKMQIVEKPGIGTLYAFRGPRSHRLVSLLVPSPDWQRHREHLAMQKAAERANRAAFLAELRRECWTADIS